MVRKHQVRFEEKKIKVFRNLGRDLSETIMSDEHLRFIEVLVAFAFPKEPKEQATSQKEVVPDLVLRLVDDIIERNQGMIKFELDETKGKRVISLKFPVERRRLVHYD